MTMHRALIACCLAALSCMAEAASPFPTRPASIIVPQAPGGANDVLARIVSGKLSEYWGQPVLVDFRPGGGAVVATQFVARSAPDGHVIGLVTTAFASDPAIRKLPYDAVRDFAPVARLGFNVVGLVVVPSLNVADVRGLIELARNKPNALSHGSNGVGAAGHVAAELFKSRIGVEMVHVPYKGGAQLYADMIGGRIPVAFAVLNSAMPLVKSGKLKALAVTNLQRSRIFPEYPPLSDTVPGYEFTIWTGFAVPAATPKDVVQKLSADVLRLAAAPELRPKFNELGYETAPMGAAEFAEFIKAEMQTLGKLMRDAGIKSD
jgi:tripartite-type tricarboxylate transporter receptor subunit TctC